MLFCEYDVEEIKESCKEILDRLCDEEEDFVYFLDSPTRHNFDNVREYMANGTVITTRGETKAILFCDGEDDILSNFVIKIPFIGEDIDYCKYEVHNYNRAKEEGLSEFFAPCMKVFDYGEYDTPIYVMLRVEVDCDRAECVMSDAFHRVYESENPCSEDEDKDEYDRKIDDYFWSNSCDENFFTEIREDYDAQLADNLEDFCGENCINDIHSANFGFQNDQIVLIDYSGYGLTVNMEDKVNG